MSDKLKDRYTLARKKLTAFSKTDCDPMATLTFMGALTKELGAICVDVFEREAILTKQVETLRVALEKIASDDPLALIEYFEVGPHMRSTDRIYEDIAGEALEATK